MANCILGMPVHSDVTRLYIPTLSGGSWLSDLPLLNLQDRRFQLVARSTNLLTASTQFETNLGLARSVRLVALINNNLSATATVRIRASASAGVFGAPLYDSGAVSAWSSGRTAENSLDMTSTFLHVLPEAVSARYWLIEITDAANTDGYVDIGRLMICEGYQPTYNFDYGLKITWDASDSVRQKTDGGAAVYLEKKRARQTTFVLNEVIENEAFLKIFQAYKRQGITKQLFFIYDPDETTFLHDRAFPCVFQTLSPLENIGMRWGIPVSLIEEL